MQFGNSAKRILGIIMYEIFRILLHKIVTINNEKTNNFVTSVLFCLY